MMPVMCQKEAFSEPLLRRLRVNSFRVSRPRPDRVLAHCRSHVRLFVGFKPVERETRTRFLVMPVPSIYGRVAAYARHDAQGLLAFISDGHP